LVGHGERSTWRDCEMRAQGRSWREIRPRVEGRSRHSSRRLREACGKPFGTEHQTREFVRDSEDRQDVRKTSVC
jgi:hypothetical protein